MSQYFDDAATGETLWHPATRVAQLFFRMTEAMMPVADCSCGVVDLQTDAYAVNSEVFIAFVDVLVTQYLASNHVIFKAMLAGYQPPGARSARRGSRALEPAG